MTYGSVLLSELKFSVWNVAIKLTIEISTNPESWLFPIIWHVKFLGITMPWGLNLVQIHPWRCVNDFMTFRCVHYTLYFLQLHFLRYAKPSMNPQLCLRLEWMTWGNCWNLPLTHFDSLRRNSKLDKRHRSHPLSSWATPSSHPEDLEPGTGSRGEDTETGIKFNQSCAVAVSGGRPRPKRPSPATSRARRGCCRKYISSNL